MGLEGKARTQLGYHQRSPAATPQDAAETLTFLPRALLHVRVAGYHDNLDHEAVAALPDHVDDLPVTNLHHVLTVDLRHRGTKSSTVYSTVYWLVEERDSNTFTA